MPDTAPVTPAISFAIPYYDNPGYLGQASRSVLAQTVHDWELVVVDDAGPQPAGELVKSFADSRITYIRNPENLGLTGNWNEAYRSTRAPLVTLLHGDDRLLPTYAERVLRAASRNPSVSAIFTDVNIIGPEGHRTWTIADIAKRAARRDAGDHDIVGEGGLAALLSGNYILCSTLCLRRELLSGTPFDARWRFVPDYDFTCGQLLAGNRLHGIREPLLEYRRHHGSQTSVLTGNATRFAEEIEFLKLMQSKTAALGWTRAERIARRRVTVRGHLALRIGLDLGRGRIGPARQKWRVLRSDIGTRDSSRPNDPDTQKRQE